MRLPLSDTSSSIRTMLPRRLTCRLAISRSRASSCWKASSSTSRMPARLVELCRDTSQFCPLYSLASEVINAPVRSSQSPSWWSSTALRRGVVVPELGFLPLPPVRCVEDLLFDMEALGAEGVRWWDRERERGFVAECPSRRGVVGADLPCR